MGDILRQRFPNPDIPRRAGRRRMFAHPVSPVTVPRGDACPGAVTAGHSAVTALSRRESLSPGCRGTAADVRVRLLMRVCVRVCANVCVFVQSLPLSVSLSSSLPPSLHPSLPLSTLLFPREGGEGGGGVENVLYIYIYSRIENVLYI